MTDATAGETVRLQRPLDEALQLLPGRLQVIEGGNRGQDIRFIRTPGEVPSITIGREYGPPDRHVRLEANTVSRLHARMQFEDGRWRISNLSLTNPLVLNGQALPVAAGSRLLDEGDRIEIGEVVLRFRER
jgi:pSer/pThr/pTyr-binding forkhead associated (FHA) protein